MIAYAEAWFALDAGDDAACRAALSKTLALAHKHDYLNFSWCHPSVLKRLCIKALETDIETAFVRRFIRIRRIVPDAPPVHLEHWPWDLKVYTLGRFSLVKDDTALRFNGKAQRRPLQMLKVLIAMGGREVSEIHLSEALWPEAEGDNAHSSFTTTLSRLRKLIGEHSLYFRDGCLSLDARRCWVDTWAFQRILGEAQDAPSEDGAEALAHQAMDLYHGPFLDSEEDAPWLRLPRERLRKRLVEAVIAHAQRLEAAGRRHQSPVLLGKALVADPDIQELFDYEIAP
jgi:two-component SAPR family response regulator